ncbi:MAG: hypothetical protein ABEJ07_04780 [Candidatus Nanohaloarchaea archaeon]
MYNNLEYSGKLLGNYTIASISGIVLIGLPIAIIATPRFSIFQYMALSMAFGSGMYLAFRSVKKEIRVLPEMLLALVPVILTPIGGVLLSLPIWIIGVFRNRR